VDVFIAFSPERIDAGTPGRDVHQVPKIVSGITPTCCQVAEALYRSVALRTVPVSSPETAEMAKLLENIYRNINIALVNELKTLCLHMGLDVWEVIEAAATKPFGFHAFHPGPGLGGHCIPVDPYYLCWKAREFGLPLHLVELAGDINMTMPELVVRRVAEALNARQIAVRGSHIVMLGVAYKKNVSDTRESPAIRIASLLQAAGAHVRYSDPHVPVLRAAGLGGDVAESVTLTEAVLGAADCVLIVTDHDNYDYQWIVDHAPLVVDTRNATKGCKAPPGRIWQA